MTLNGSGHSVKRHDNYYGGSRQSPKSDTYIDVFNPANGEVIGHVADTEVDDVDLAVASAVAGQREWAMVEPLERARVLREIATVVRRNADEIAYIDALDCGNPIDEMRRDVLSGAAQLEFFAGLVTEMKGQTVPAGTNALNLSVREPLGVVARINPFNHPAMFAIGKSAAPLAAGNAVVTKSPEQAPLSALLIAELMAPLLPAGVYNALSGGRAVGERLVQHPDIAKIALIGSVPTGKAVMRAASDSLKGVLLELGGKNALLAFPDSDPETVASAVVRGMNFTWCGQSCGSTSRALIHRDIYEEVLSHIARNCEAFVPGVPTRSGTTMGAISSEAQYRRVLDFIATTKAEGGRLIYGGTSPQDPELAGGYFMLPTVFADVTPAMRLANEEVFGPVLAVAPWDDLEAAIAEVNRLPYGLTCSIWTRDIITAHRTASRVEAGYVWINEVSKHFLGTPFGGYKQSGVGREECLQELLEFTQEKHIHVNLGA